jgi:DNA sulfur modification protein DndD
VILFGGKNGAGKSTLFEAVRLCLYGPKAFGGSLSKDAYLSYLNSRIHSNPTLLIQPSVASIALDFNYANAGQVHAYRVTRSWERRGSQKVQEHVEVARDGKALEEVSDEYWQDFVRDMVPPGISQLFFFDGEKIQHLAEDASDQASLADSIKSLLGLDLIDRLQSDIGYFISRQIAPSLDQESSREIQTLERDRDALQTQVEQLRMKRGDFESTLTEHRLAIQRVETKLTSSGGTFSRSRESLIQKKATIKAAITQLEAALRQLCAGMLPFALAPTLCQQVANQLVKEESIAHAEAGIKLLQDAKKELVQRIASAPLWASLPPAIKNKIRRQVTEIVNQPLEMESAVHDEPIHHISPTERHQILSWIQQTKTEIPIFLQAMGTELESFYRDLTKVDVSLKKIPADEVIKPLVEELNQLHHQFAELDRQAKEIEQETAVTDARLAEATRVYQKQLASLAERDSVKSRTRLASKVQTVLSDYHTALLEKKVLELQDAVSKSFNTLCRKKDSLRRVAIDPKDFSVTLYDKQGRPLPKSQLSAGEKQIYAVSMLWALGKISGRPLPIMIDTPLGRLDSDHRNLLVTEYFPAASHQVIIFSTDTEIDQTYFSKLKRAVTQAYSLEFDPAEYSTKISKGYWWSGNDETH